MSAETTKHPGPAPATIADVRLEITPSTEQYEQLCRDLAALRRCGADSNTAAVLSAVHAAAAAKLEGG